MTTDGFIGRWIRFLLYLQNMFYKVKSVPVRCENHKGLGKGLVLCLKGLLYKNRNK